MGDVIANPEKRPVETRVTYGAGQRRPATRLLTSEEMAEIMGRPLAPPRPGLMARLFAWITGRP
ncbi:MAG: hypothetical protein V7668_09065 [Cereibacter changlensis]|uniref:Uncharacterized protein n=2 Tax=Cereibacter changlensis TaxID=402884 RepID=A0A2T4JZR8_9RHOB|nr:hypothetical protein [Cereibacter changlensis]PTE23404.1 hypothetical protein C5F48_02105 [Cereibacter changlensis JA139]PZX49747.1 hypothetical protein LX76_03749 [Cereibacter changlensis]